MKYHNPLEFLIGSNARFVVGAFARRGSFLLLLALAVLLVTASVSWAKPPQAPPVLAPKPVQAPTVMVKHVCTSCPCGIDGCPCGCCQRDYCTCGKDVISGKKKPDCGCTYSKVPVGLLGTDCTCNPTGTTRCQCGDEDDRPDVPIRRGTLHPELRKPYAKQWQAEGWTFNAAGGYWEKTPPQSYPVQQHWSGLSPSFQSYQPQFQPMMFQPSFGGFGGGGFGGFSGGGGGGGGC